MLKNKLKRVTFSSLSYFLFPPNSLASHTHAYTSFSLPFPPLSRSPFAFKHSHPPSSIINPRSFACLPLISFAFFHCPSLFSFFILMREKGPREGEKNEFCVLRRLRSRKNFFLHPSTHQRFALLSWKRAISNLEGRKNTEMSKKTIQVAVIWRKIDETFFTSKALLLQWVSSFGL